MLGAKPAQNSRSVQLPEGPAAAPGVEKAPVPGLWEAACATYACKVAEMPKQPTTSTTQHLLKKINSLAAGSLKKKHTQRGEIHKKRKMNFLVGLRDVTTEKRR